jgi:class 3 adenylate cyclase
MEMASVLFTDIVGFSLNPMEKQTELLRTLQAIVRATEQFRKAQAAGDLISLPTGDGMALVFFRDPAAPVKCAIEIQTELRSHPELPLRIGVHTGPIFRHSDIKDDVNVVGGGINLAQRVMDCGDAGHILISRPVAEVLAQFAEWPAWLHDLGTCEVKHGVRLQLYNVYRDGAGNPETPAKLKARPPRRWPTWAGIAAALLIALYLTYAYTDLFHKRDTQPAGAKSTLRYYVTVQKYRNGKPYEEPFRLSGERVFEAGYQVRLVMSSPVDTYLYVLNEGPKSTPEKPSLNTLFPRPTAREGSARLSANEELNIPPGGFILFDAEKGVEKLWVIWAKAAIPELEALKTLANPQDRGVIANSEQARAIMALLKKYAAAKVDIERDETNRMTILTGYRDILAYIIRLDHD